MGANPCKGKPRGALQPCESVAEYVALIFSGQGYRPAQLAYVTVPSLLQPDS
jgi:hypothetical protein